MKHTGYLLVAVLFSISCTTINKNSPYQDMKTLEYNGNFAYEFKSRDAASDALLISLAGSGWSSALGEYRGNEWRFTGTGALLLQAVRNDHTILIPEKWDRRPGVDYYHDADARYRYTKENLVDCYVAAIDAYLAEHNYATVILAGTSEGAALLPLVYERIKNRDLVKDMISIAAGGLSMYESYLISIKKDGVPDFWRSAYAHSIDLHENLADYAESTETTPQGLVHRQMASFMDLRPFDYYRNISIPVLFIHGKNDMNIAVESTRYIQEHLPGQPFDYIYYNMGHIPMEESENAAFREDIAAWVGSLYRK